MSSVKFQDHTAQKILDFDPNRAFPDCNSTLNSLMVSNDAQSLKQYKRVALLFSQLSNSLDLPCLGLYAYFSNEPFQCILRWTGTLYLFKMAWLSKVAKSLYATILIYPISLDFFKPDNVYSPCPFVFLTATSSSINTPCLPVCLSVRHTSLALSRM